MKLVVMGPQGSGKSTQARLLAERLSVPHLSTGVIFRAMTGEDALSQKVRACLSRGELVPDADVLAVLTAELRKPVYESGFVLDGFPRNVWQAERLPIAIDKVFYLRVADEVGMKRIAPREGGVTPRGRADDTAELIRKRLADYHQGTEPVLDYYRERGLLEEVDGERPVAVIFEDILTRVRPGGLGVGEGERG